MQEAVPRDLITYLILGTSNWSGDYFTDTAGVSFVFKPTSIKIGKNKDKSCMLQHLQDTFMRDWKSKLALPLP